VCLCVCVCVCVCVCKHVKFSTQRLTKTLISQLVAHFSLYPAQVWPIMDRGNRLGGVFTLSVFYLSCKWSTRLVIWVPCNKCPHAGYFLQMTIGFCFCFCFYLLLLLYWGYIVTFRKVLTICHRWICPLHHSPKDHLL
jgi:hypothetical protein